jgi:Tol biopolymer transport system component
MRYQCLEIANGLSPSQTMQGVLVFNNDDNTDAYLWNVQTGTQTRFPRKEGDRLFDFAVSPDKKRVMYYSQPSDWQINIAAVDGQLISTYPVSTDSFVWAWFDNERLINLVHKQDSSYLVLLSLFTGQRQELPTDFPNIDDTPWTAYSGFISSFYTTVYDPTLTRVIYPECDPACKDRLRRGEEGWPVVLWDIEKRKVLARLVTTDFYGNKPIWSPDGTQFIMSADIHPVKYVDLNNQMDEFFAISRDGEIRRLTHFEDHFVYSEIYDSYSLSPDGRLVAFWMIAKPSQYEDARLAVVNIETGEVTNYCIKGDPFGNNLTPDSLLSPIWSPDGTQLLVISRDPEDTSVRRVVVVDIVHEYAATIAKDVMPVGWMTTEP